jgi:hypothetical protein
MTPMKKMREVFLYELILEKNLFHLLISITIFSESSLKLTAKTISYKKFDKNHEISHKTGNSPFLPNGKLGWADCLSAN